MAVKATSQRAASAGPASQRARWAAAMQSGRLQKGLFVAAVLAPMLAFFAVFWVAPLVSGAYGSLTVWRAFNPARTFIGLRHYTALLNDATFRTALWNTFAYALFYVPASIAVALLLALGIQAAGRLRSTFRMVYFLPVVTSEIATALIWAWLYQPRYGLFNQLLSLANGPQLGFLRDPRTALFWIALYALWKNLGYTIVLFMAGLSSIPRPYYDAARVDGADTWALFRHITLPLLQPTFVFVLITGMIGALQVFGPVYVMTARTGNDLPGGPLNSTLTVAVYQWQATFRELNLGYGAAMGITLFAVVLGITLLQVSLLRRRWAPD